MELFSKLISTIDQNLILSFFPMVLTLLLINWIFKDRFDVQSAFNIIRWIVISYTLAIILHLVIGLILEPTEWTFDSPATRTYSFAYWLMLLSATILPLTLFNKKLASHSFYILIVVVMMKIGWYFERFVIFATSLHRDHISVGNIFDLIFSRGILMFVSQGVILAILALLIIELIKKR